MKKLTGISLFIFFVVVTAILTAGLVFYDKNKVSNISTPPKGTPEVGNLNTTPPTSNVRVLNAQEVAKHNTNADCWMLINNKVYNLSDYASAHPGGTRAVTNYCGKEATQMYDTKGGNGNAHSGYAHSLLDQYYIGDFNQKTSSATLQQNIQKIQANPPVATRGGDYKDD